jgi:tetratricopeptide (TPR) repeat protein
MFPIHPRRIAVLCTLAFSLMAAAQSGAAANQTDDIQSLLQSANTAREAGNADEAIRDYSRAVALRPGWAEGWWDLGSTQYEANHYAEAVRSLQRLTELAPAMAPGWSILGLAEFETKDYSGALASLENAQKLGGIDDPEIARVSSYHLALLLIRNGEFERAAALLRSVFGETPPSQARVALGLALLRVPLLPSEVDPSQDAFIQEVGDAAANLDPSQALAELTQQNPHVPWLHYAYGLALEATGQTQEALEQQKAESAISPASDLPWIGISRLTLRLKEPQRALSAAKRAVVLDDKSSAAHEALAKALAALGRTQQAAVEARESARFAQTSSRPDRRMTALYGVHSNSSTAAENSAAWNEAMQEYSAAHYPQTITALKSWVERNPNDGTAWAVMGLSEFSLQDYDNARIHLQRGINLGLKGSAESLQLASDRLALLLIRNGEFGAASTLLAPLAGHPPMASKIQLALGLALLRIATMPDDLDASHRDLAQSAGAIVELLLASRYTDAFPAFQTLIAEHPSTPWLHYAYGEALDSLSQYDEAKAQMQAELKISPHSALPWIQVASIDVRQHLPADALQAAQTAVSMAPDSAEAHYELGRAWLESGDAQKAIAELEKANGITPDNPEVHFVLARAYTKANQPEKAAAERAAFMQLKEMASKEAEGAGQGQSILPTNTQ